MLVTMPRVLPSQIVAIIDRIFPDAREPPDPQRPVIMRSEHAPWLSAIVKMTGDLPQELLTISGEDFTGLIVGVAALETAVTTWRGRGPSVDTPRFVPGTDRKSALHLIRAALVQCPDQAPSPQTADLPFISDLNLRESIRADISAAYEGLHNAQWKTATVMAGAVAEALLLWAIQSHPGLAALQSKPPAPPEKWDLSQFIAVAQNLTIITQRTVTQTDLARTFRNLIHPGRAARLGEVCNRATALSALAAVEFIVSDLS